jgi:hypothetical protein
MTILVNKGFVELSHPVVANKHWSELAHTQNKGDITSPDMLLHLSTWGHQYSSK